MFDTANAEYIVLLDASGDETVRPVEVKEFPKSQNGGHVMAVDPRNAGADMLADEWVAVRPGYELAFLLGIMGDIAKKGDFDASSSNNMAKASKNSTLRCFSIRPNGLPRSAACRLTRFIPRSEAS